MIIAKEDFMKRHRQWIVLLAAITLSFSLSACAGNSEIGESDVETSLSDSQTAETLPAGEQQENTRAENTTAIIMDMNGTEVHATLNDTVTAQEFMKLLPYEVTVSRAADDLCGSVSEELDSDAGENSDGWKLGEIGWFGGWFTILVDNEAAFANHSVMIIGTVDEADLPYVQSLTGQVDISIRLAEKAETDTDTNTSKNEGDETMITLTVNGSTLTATLADNSSAEALKELLADGPLTVQMSDYASMEKVGSLGTNLPTNNEQITTEAGDLILYQGSALVIYYAPNSWNFTRLGKIHDVTAAELKEILGSGDVEVTLAMVE